MFEITIVSLPHLAKLEGVSYQTAYNRSKEGAYVRVLTIPNGHRNPSKQFGAKYIPPSELKRLLNAAKGQ